MIYRSKLQWKGESDVELAIAGSNPASPSKTEFLNLRYYQENQVVGIARKIKQGYRKICGQLATGGGKTVIFSSITDRFLKKSDGSVLIVVHRIELLQQTRKALFNSYGIEAFEIKAGVKFIPYCKVYVAMVESLANRMKKLGDKNIKMLITDECHIASFNKIQQYFPEPCIILGFTATPLSSQKKFPVNMFYEDIVCGVDIPELIAGGHLCQNITKTAKEIVDRHELAVKGNDYDDSLMAQAFSRPKYIKNTVDQYEKFARDKKTLIFNVNVDHSKEVARAFSEAGYDCKHLDGNTPKDERRAILHWFKNTKDAVLCNVGIATVGFDEPTVECVIVNKATLSMPLWIQMCGRGSRPINIDFIERMQKHYDYELSIKTFFLVIDMGGNGMAHGDWNLPRDWAKIFHNPPKPGSQEGVPPMKSCPQCDALIHAAVTTCPWCGYEYDKKSIPMEIELGEFVTITKNIDVEELMRQNELKKDYYTLFLIARKLVKECKNNITVMTLDYANFILQLYFEKAKEWIQAYNKKKNAHKKFNQWHKDKVTEVLFNELKTQFPEWESPLQSATTEELTL